MKGTNMDYERLTYCCRERSKREMKDITQITLEEATTTITDLLAHVEVTENTNNQLNGIISTLMESNKKENKIEGHKPCYGLCCRCVWRYNGGCSEWKGD